MDLGTFSISLNVKSLTASLEFYRAFGFEEVGGDADEGWMLVRNGNAIIGLYEKTYDANVLTFYPPDLRAVQREMRSKGYDFELDEEASQSDEGPAHSMLADPDGNLVLLEQY